METSGTNELSQKNKINQKWIETVKIRTPLRLHPMTFSKHLFLKPFVVLVVQNQKTSYSFQQFSLDMSRETFSIFSMLLNKNFLFTLYYEHIFDAKVSKISSYLAHFLNHVSVPLNFKIKYRNILTWDFNFVGILNLLNVRYLKNFYHLRW